MAILLDRVELGDGDTTREEHLNLLRILGLFRAENSAEQEADRGSSRVPAQAGEFGGSPVSLGECAALWRLRCGLPGFAPILGLLEKEKDGVTQFHLAGALARISRGWTDAESLRLIRWLLSTQEGWFAERDGKGLQFGGFWNTVVNQLAGRHTAALIVLADRLRADSDLAKVAYKAIRGAPDARQGSAQGVSGCQE